MGLVLLLTVLVLSLIYGWDRRCLAATLDSALGILVTAVLGYLFTDLFQIHGAVMESSESLLYAGYQHLNLTKIFVASIFLGSSGAAFDRHFTVPAFPILHTARMMKNVKDASPKHKY